MQEYIILLLKTVAIQIVALFGIFFVFGFVLNKIQNITQKKYYNSTGWKGILWTAWFGTPIHEFGHFIFAVIFGHNIKDVILFKPNQLNGNLGHVDHSYKKYSLYQRLGNFFIGGAPMIFGSTLLFLMLYFLLPNGKEVFAPLSTDILNWQQFFSGIYHSILNLFTIENLNSWSFWLFLYLSFCIATHISPSKQDRKGMWDGLAFIILLLVLANAVSLALGVNISKYILWLKKYTSIFTAIFTYVFIISIVHLIVASIILYPIKKIKQKMLAKYSR